jgi:hypothetical protein
MPKRKMSEIEKFIALPDTAKERAVRALDKESLAESLARSRPLNEEDRRRWGRFKSKMGRPKVGKGAKTISLSVERGLLARADAFAKKHGMSRARLVAAGLKAIIGDAA